MFILGIVVLENVVLNLAGEMKLYKLNKNLRIADEVCKERISSVLKWYEKKAFLYKYKFILYSVVTITLSAIIPIINLGKYTIPILGIDSHILLVTWISVILSIISGYLFLRTPKERWNEYRKYAERIKVIIFEGYAREQNDKEILLQIEKLISKENNEWYERNTQENREEERA